MAVEDVLAGISGALNGGLEGYRWQKQREDRQRERQDILDAREEDRRIRKDAEARRQREDDDKKAATAAERAAQDAIINSLPDGPLKQALLARQSGLNVDAKDFTPPPPEPIHGRALPNLGLGGYGYEATFGDGPGGAAARAGVGPVPGVAPKYSIDPQVQAANAKTAAAAAAATAKRAAAIEDYEAKKRIDRQYDKPLKATIPVTPKDDPSLPRGVKQYLGTLRQRYNTLDGAVGEFNAAIDDLFAEHQNLDAAKARRFIDTLYKPTASVSKPQSEVDRMIKELQGQALPAAPESGQSRFSAIASGTRSLLGREPLKPPSAGDPATALRGGGFQQDVSLPVENVSDADIDTLAKSILTARGVPATPENLKTFTSKKPNRDRLIQQIKRVRADGGR